MVHRQAIPISDVLVASAQVTLPGFLALPEEASGIVLFAHGRGSSRFSPRNRFVAEVLNEAGLATLLFDLLTPSENRIDEQTRQFRFDVRLLAARLRDAVDWAHQREATAAMRIGLFGASTGAAAALIAAADRPELVGAGVARGGRPDLAGEALPRVQSPTLLIVGGDDLPVLELNRHAAQMLRVEHRVDVVPGATHLFEEPGALEQASQLARDWFVKYLAGQGGGERTKE